MRRRPSRPSARTPGSRREAHSWDPVWLDRGSRVLPDDHGLPFELAQDRLERAWSCGRCGSLEKGPSPPSRYLRVSLPALGAFRLLCGEAVAWRVMES